MKTPFVAGFFIILFLMAGCVASKQSNSAATKRYLALGDSYTIGESVSSTDNFPFQLYQKLNAKGGAVWSEPEIIARTGWRTDQLKAAIESATLKHQKYDLVTLLIGVNNEFQGRSADQFGTEFEALLQTAIRLAGGDSSKVWVVSIPDYGFTPYGKARQTAISARIDMFNTMKKTIATKLGVRFIDITGISRKGLETPDLVASDGLHPSAKMYGRWVETMMLQLER